MSRVVHFELLADDPERALKFWGDTFGWQAPSWEGATYWLVTTGEDGVGINGGIMRRSDFPEPVNAICTVDVDDIDAAVAKVEANGGSVVRPRFEVGDVGLSAYCKDTEGTVFGLWQSLQASPS